MGTDMADKPDALRCERRWTGDAGGCDCGGERRAGSRTEASDKPHDTPREYDAGSWCGRHGYAYGDAPAHRCRPALCGMDQYEQSCGHGQSGRIGDGCDIGRVSGGLLGCGWQWRVGYLYGHCLVAFVRQPRLALGHAKEALAMRKLKPPAQSIKP